MLKKHDERVCIKKNALKGGNGAVMIKHCFQKKEFSSTIRHCSTTIIPPGSGIGLHKHENEEEIYIVVNGQGILDDGKTKRTVQKGDVVLTKNGESHSLLNNGENDLEIIAVIACY